MKIFIVPTDFSDTSKNAARYAARMAAALSDVRIILYNVFDKIDTESSDGSVVYNDHSARRIIMELALESVKTDMNGIAPGVNITCIAEEESSFIDSLERLASHQGANLIIMGITGATPIAQIFIGSNTLSMVNKNVCPVMIVPPNAEFTGIKNIAFTSDFKDVERTTPVNALRNVLDIFKPFIHVVNVDSEHYVELTEEYKAERAKLETILAGYETEYYFMRQFDFVDAINQFVSDYKVDMIFTVPRKHSFLGGLFKSSHTKKLAYHSHVPLVAVHE
ncbi:MAG TPA: universal stress protein, partial [Chitinophagaceae bacterium]|jgi:nucleotide-binding universal stress UspA family protein|nr:universal stress protein [Chitinophagaceae bacterium]